MQWYMEPQWQEAVGKAHIVYVTHSQHVHRDSNHWFHQIKKHFGDTRAITDNIKP